MGDLVIKVEQLSKRYRIGQRERKADTFFGQMIDMVRSPVSNFKKISGLSKFKQEDDPSVFWALKDISFEVRQGQVLGIIGHNAAGKSTLLKILSRITSPTSGQASIKGRISTLLEVGTGFHPELTGRDNIYMNGTILGMRKREIDSKLEAIIEFSGISGHIDTPVKFYSSGMKVRLAFSIAAHLEPEILIIDEVLAVGDMEFQNKCLGKIESAADSGRTILFVSHDMAAVQALCTQGIILEKGRAVFQGNVTDSLKYYQETLHRIDAVSKIKSLYIKDIYLKNSKGEHVSTFRMGEDIVIEMELPDHAILSLVHINFFITDYAGTKIATASSAMKKPIIHDHLTKKIKAIYVIKSPPLMEDSYKIDLSITYKTGGKIEFHSTIFKFNIMAADVYGSGIRLTGQYGKIFLDFLLKIESAGAI